MTGLNIAVLGAGVIGLTTAVELQKQYRDASIEVFADKFRNETTSYVAAGLFRPGTSFCGPTEQITRKWINDSYHYWEELYGSVDSTRAGITELSGYLFSSEYESLVRNPYIEKLVPVYRKATHDELKLCPGDWKYGCFFTTFLTECSIYLPWVEDKICRNGGKIVKHHIDTFNQIPDKFDVVVNCTGLGAKWLCNDHQLVPLRGQVLKVNAPQIRTFFYGDYDTYVIPGFNSVTLGGCRQLDSYNTEVNKFDSLSIRERCESLVPSLKNARVVAEKVGLRPHRSTVRVEKEIIVTSNRKIKVVHNYGHGGYGVTTAPGTSLYCIQLIKEILTGNSKL